MKSVNWWAVVAGIGLAFVLILAGISLAQPGRHFDIPVLPGETVAPATEVYITPGGSKYHRQGCSSLKNSQDVWKVTPDAAEADGYEACQRCKPR